VSLIGVPLLRGADEHFSAIQEAGNGLVYAVPSRGGQVLEIDPASGRMAFIGQPLKDQGWGLSYTALALANNGKLYAAPAYAQRVLEIDPEAKVVKEIGPDFHDEEAEEGGHYRGIVLARNGCLYAPPAAPGHILEINPATGVVSQIGPRIEDGIQNLYSSIAMVDNGCLYALPDMADKVLEFDPATRQVALLLGGADGPPGYYEDITVADNGKLYSVWWNSELSSFNVIEFNPKTKVLQCFDDLELETQSPYPNTGVSKLERAPDGRLFAICKGEKLDNTVLLEVDPKEGTAVLRKVSDLMVHAPSAASTKYETLKPAGNGRLYALPSDEADKGHVLEFDAERNEIRELKMSTSGGSLPACDLAITASNGNLLCLPVRPRNAQGFMVTYPPVPKHPSKPMLSSWGQQLQNGELSDVTLKTSQGRTYHAHKLILAASPVFRSMFYESKMREATQDPTVELGDVSPSVSDIFVKNIYGDGVADAQKLTWQEVCELVKLFHRFEFDELMASAIQLLTRTVCTGNVCELLGFADKHQLSDLKQSCLDAFVAHPQAMDLDEWEEVSDALAREVAEALGGRQRRKRRRSENYEFPAGSDWAKLTKPALRRACAERGIAQDGLKADLLARLQAS